MRETLFTLAVVASCFQVHGLLVMSRDDAPLAAQRYKPFQKHPTLFPQHGHGSCNFDRNWVHPDLLKLSEILSGSDDDKKEDVSRLLLKEEVSNAVYSFNCFTKLFLQMITQEIDNFYVTARKEDIRFSRPNSMNNYGVVVNEIGMRPLITSFQQTYLVPIARHLFPQQQGSQLDDHHSFLVRYQADEDVGLDMHVDDSDVTFNVCLGNQGFTGATLSFCGLFGAPNHRQLSHVYHHEIGRAVIHLGSHRHGADDIQSGTRQNLIIWNHNWKWRGTAEYRERRSRNRYQREQGPPDPVCVSYKHDWDCFSYKSKADIPNGRKRVEFMRGWCPPPGKEHDGHPGRGGR